MNQLHALFPKFKNQEEYLKFKNIAEDSAKLNETLLEYELTALKFIATMEKENTIIHRDSIILSDMVQWLSENKLKNIGKNRAKYFAHIARIKYCINVISDQ